MHYQLNLRPTPQRRLKRGRPHDLISRLRYNYVLYVN